MRTFLLVISLIFILTSCTNTIKEKQSNSLSYDDIGTLISSKKDSLLFLSFWSNINNEDFANVIQFEEHKGNLRNGKFPIVFKNENNIDSIPFTISSGNNIIELNFKDQIKGKIKSYNEKEAYLYKAEKYKFLESHLISNFDNKYNRSKMESDLGIDLNRYSSLWWIDKKNNRVIEFKSKIKYVFNGYNGISLTEILNGENSTTEEYGVSTDGYRFLGNIQGYIDNKDKKHIVLDCSISIKYQMMNVFVEERAKKQERQKKTKQEIEKEDKEKELYINKNNNKL